MKLIRDVKRGEIYYAYLPFTDGSGQGKKRPCVVVQNNETNDRARQTIVAAVTSKDKANGKFTTVKINAFGFGSWKQFSYVKCSNLYTIDQDELLELRGMLSVSEIKKMDIALKTSLGMLPKFPKAKNRKIRLFGWTLQFRAQKTME